MREARNEGMRERSWGERSPCRGQIEGFRGVRRCGGVELKLRRLGECVLCCWDIGMPANDILEKVHYACQGLTMRVKGVSMILIYKTMHRHAG